MLKLLVCLVVFLSGSVAIPIDNGLEGLPEVECGSNSIIVTFQTRNIFEGHVYVKGQNADPTCRNGQVGRLVAGIEVEFGTCNVRRSRSLNPKGVFVRTTIVVTFHPQFLTKIDRAFRVQCFYMEADKTVDTGLVRVSMLPTTSQMIQVPMPVCRYEVLLGGPSGPSAEFAVVGEQVFHKWTCDTETVDIFCMVVHSCYVDTADGERVELIGADGCAVDRYLLNNPDYSSNLMAGVEAHVFKFADRAEMYFQCQITILVKEPDSGCPRPFCAAPPGRGAGESNPPLGAKPIPPEHPFPLIEDSPYLPDGNFIQINQPLINRGGNGREDSGQTPGTNPISFVNEGTSETRIGGLVPPFNVNLEKENPRPLERPGSTIPSGDGKIPDGNSGLIPPTNVNIRNPRPETRTGNGRFPSSGGLLPPINVNVRVPQPVERPGLTFTDIIENEIPVRTQLPPINVGETPGSSQPYGPAAQTVVETRTAYQAGQSPSFQRSRLNTFGIRPSFAPVGRAIVRSLQTRRKRDLEQNEVGVVDVEVVMTTLDMNTKVNYRRGSVSKTQKTTSDQVCLSVLSFGLLLTLTTVLLVTAVSVVVYSVLKRKL